MNVSIDCMKQFIWSLLLFAGFILIQIYFKMPQQQVTRVTARPSFSPAASVVLTHPEVAGAASASGELYTVTHVVDGDTIKVSLNNTMYTVRLIGIDTPEVVDPRRTVQCYGQEASDYAKSLLKDKRVYLQSDSSQDNVDHYTRLLRYVFLEDGTLVNKVLISHGYAYEYTYRLPYLYQKEFKMAQEEAERGKLGLWGEETCAGKR